jgi:DNA-binding MarR family transcriptional regulator
MSALAENAGARPGELARMLRLAPNTVTTLINALAPRGLISRSPSADDRRAIAMQLTEQGQEALGAWQSTNADVLRTAVSALPPEQRSALSQAVPALDALARAIDDITDSAS